MKKLLLLLFFTGNMSMAQTQLTVMSADSKVMWTGTKITGYHQGIVKIKEGKIEMRDHKLTGGYFILDMSTITVTDIPDTDPIPKRNLENHLKDGDFFDVHRYPTAKFVITSVNTQAENPRQHRITGNLTIKGITRPHSLQAEVKEQTHQLFVAKAEMKFDRQQFGVAYKGLKDELVHDLVKLDIVVTAREKASNPK